MAIDEPVSHFVTAPDGLKLHVRVYGPRSAPGLPVVCLPGLARTAADFDALEYAITTSLGTGVPPRCLPRVSYRLVTCWLSLPTRRHA